MRLFLDVSPKELANAVAVSAGGGTHGKYRYLCQSCHAGWQQIPPHKLSNNVSTCLLFIGRAQT